MPTMDFSQHQVQSQVQALSQKQIQSLEILSYGTEDLREAVYRAAEENPALLITGDSFSSGVDVKKHSPLRDGTHLSSRVSEAASLASDNFEAALEAHADTRQSLKEHLLSQFRVLPLSETEIVLGENLIQNLDSKGFHILSPVSVLSRCGIPENSPVLHKVLGIIQSLDPVGTCTANTEESLLVQARLSGKASPFTLFILEGHLDFLDPPRPDRVVAKYCAFKKQSEKMFALPKNVAESLSLDPTEEDAASSIAFIRTLDPFPARDFGSVETQYVSPDVSVMPLKETPGSSDEKDGIVTTNEGSWIVRCERGVLPEVSLNPEFLLLEADEKKKNLATKEELKVVRASLRKARDFLDAVSFRESTVFRAMCRITFHQGDFFKNGPGHLVALRQQDIALELGVHESTISRMANGKFVQCEWGLFELKYFFSAKTVGDTSREKVMGMIQEILSLQKEGEKSLSDQKISDMLSERGVKVARRTVAKYRSMLNIRSSFER